MTVESSTASHEFFAKWSGLFDAGSRIPVSSALVLQFLPLVLMSAQMSAKVAAPSRLPPP